MKTFVVHASTAAAVVATVRQVVPAAAALVLLLVASVALAPSGRASATSTTQPSSTPGCLVSGNGYLRARLRGDLDLDLAWSDPEIECDGGPRPDGRGLRVTLAGPLAASGRRVRFVFGIADAPEGARVSARAANLTIIFEGEQRLFATRGDDKCTVDELEQQRIGALGGAQRTWRVVARGFCTAPALSADGRARLLVTRFDFASRVSFGEG